MELRTYEVLKSKAVEKEAETILEFIEAKSHKNAEEKKAVFMTKDDKIDLIQKVHQYKPDRIKWMFGCWISLALLIVANWFLKK